MKVPHRTKLPPEDDEGGGSPEEAQARAWLKAHAHDPELARASLPADHARDPETGETVDPAASSWLVDQRSSPTDELPREHNRMLRLLRVNERYLQTPTRTRAELDKRVRTERAMAYLRPDQQDLLRARFFECMTLEAIAEERGVRKQSVADKLATACQDLLVAIASTWNLPVDLAQELFGVRHEGRPARDYAGERLAAELAVEGYFAHARSQEDDQ